MTTTKKNRDALGTRMKEYYESIPKTKLTRRMPVIIRIDGKAFHTFTKGFARPFDEVLIKTMQETTKYLCENIQGCVLGYTQSDEISLVLVDYKNLNTSAWFDYEVQKMCSIAASMATMAFNKIFAKNVAQENALTSEWLDNGELNPNYKNKELQSLWAAHWKALDKGAMFDARVFNLPKEEVANYIYWRQLDASRNSVQMTGQANFSDRELQGKSCSDIQDMLMLQKGINWNNYPVPQKRGTCVIKESGFEQTRTVIEPQQFGAPRVTVNEEVHNSRWIIDTNIPIFKGEDRDYIESLVCFETPQQEKGHIK